MSISEITSSASAGTTSSTGWDSITSDFSVFLELLTAQLKSQDPLDPMDTSEFTGQLVQYASLEQQVKTNDQLTELVSAVNALTSASATGYIGYTVEADGDTAPLQDGQASWIYELDKTASAATLTITDESGAVVWTGEGSTDSGRNAFTWDGITSAGVQLTEGAYTLSITATDSDGDAVDGSIHAVGRVTGVDSSSGSTQLEMDGVSVDLTAVTRIVN